MPRLSLAYVVAILAVLFSVGCAENFDPTDPEGAYNLYVKALWAGDAEAIWERSAPSTHQYFDEQYETLREMDETIEKYLPPTDHRIAREQAGSILTAKVDDGKGLFLEVFKPGTLKLEEKHKVGATVDQIRINEDETAAELKTLGGDVYYLTKGDGADRPEEWFVMLVRSSSAVEARMKWLEANQLALKQTVEDLIDEERKKREEIIADLMKLDGGEKNAAPDEREDGESGEATAETDGETDVGRQEDSGDNGH